MSTDKSKPYIPLAGGADDGWSKEHQATATCYCGAVQLAFPTEGPGLVGTFLCHCSDCRKITASMFASNFIIADAYLKHLRGRENLKTYIPVSNQVSQSLSSDLDNNPRLSVTIAPAFVSSTTNETTSTTVITITTTIKRVNDLGKEPSSKINTKAEQSCQEADDCEPYSVTDDFSSGRERSRKDSSVDMEAAPGSDLFWCIHCERSRPAPFQAMSGMSLSTENQVEDFGD
ncbi:hypothetical protein PENARI_c009G12265 [Penicillium arizonense]|uniref:CENP-V/GFA domain-containing protein n=1 Tax=Penicillium arizonense TaxID=1835702 RepID=A0A1F5LHP1_PENAI|nr:hypothetical protein PENARI_c009G12265 [Penicillium arizonense]OGE52655.1 hypothetical protein PENARI_c009G12265 [Penicillium arizonense]